MQCDIELLALHAIKSKKLIATADVMITIGGEVSFAIRGIRLEIALDGKGVAVKMPTDRDGKAVVVLESVDFKEAVAEAVLNGAVEAGLCVACDVTA